MSGALRSVQLPLPRRWDLVGVPAWILHHRGPTRSFFPTRFAGETSANGSLLLARNEDLGSAAAQVYIVVPRETHDPGETVTLWSGAEVPQVPVTYGYVATAVFDMDYTSSSALTAARTARRLRLSLLRQGGARCFSCIPGRWVFGDPGRRYSSSPGATAFQHDVGPALLPPRPFSAAGGGCGTAHFGLTSINRTLPRPVQRAGEPTVPAGRR